MADPTVVIEACEALQREVDLALSSPGTCGTAALIGARDRARALGDVACVSPVLERHGFPHLAKTPQFPVSAAPPAPLPADKTSRDVLAPLLSVYETPDFAIRYGPNFEADTGTLQRIGEAFEAAWAVEIGDLGYRAPAGTDAYRFNVYIGDSGNQAPPAAGAAGYYYVDDEGYGYIVLSMDTAAAHEATRTTAAHEFFHALEDAALSYPYEGQGAWYWEAGACWVEGLVVPDSDDNSAFLPAFSLLPHLPVNDFLYPDGTLRSLHQYGAMLFLQHLVEVVEQGDPTLIRRSWLEATSASDPLVKLDALLQEAGHGTLAAAYADMAARESTFDWADEDAYEAHIEYWGGEDLPGATRPSGAFFGAAGSRHPPDPPYTYGRNQWKLALPPDPVRIAFVGEPGPAWTVTVSTQDGDTHARVPLPLTGEDGTQGVIELTGLLEADETWITVTAVDGPRDDGTTWDYALSVEDPEDTAVAETDDDPEETGDTERPRRMCGCSSGGITGESVAGWLVGLVVLVRARRPGPASRRGVGSR